MQKVFPPTYFLGSIFLAVVLHWVYPIKYLLVFPEKLIGLVPIIIGVLLNLRADREFKRWKTTVKPFEKSSSLLTEGVFKISRNPMYLGMSAIVLGIFLLLGSLSPLLITIILPILLDRIFICKEEKAMEETFGEQFLEYKKKVRRWL
jgi:protein-S-isoprenylcysteine O-methyltransferase Ste14